MTGAPQDLLALRRALENIITRRQREEGLSFSATQYRGVRQSGGHLSVYGETADALFRVLDRAETYAAAIDAVLAEHSRRVTELLEANNREVERRRAAEAALQQRPIKFGEDLDD